VSEMVSKIRGWYHAEWYQSSRLVSQYDTTHLVRWFC